MELPATLFTAGAAGLLLLWLSYRVTQRRMGARISLGDGGDEAMLKRVRAHANFVEYVPLLLILLGLNEMRGESPWLWAAGLLIILGRLAHVRGMELPAPNLFRAGGMLLTWTVMAALSVTALLAAL